MPLQERRTERLTILAANHRDTFQIHIRPSAVVGVLTNNHENPR
jgi:hypothetical protein